VLANLAPLLEYLPKELAKHIDINGTSAKAADNSYLLKLSDSTFLKIQFEKNSIVNILRV
jgi:hypothetical protein